MPILDEIKQDGNLFIQTFYRTSNFWRRDVIKSGVNIYTDFCINYIKIFKGNHQKYQPQIYNEILEYACSLNLINNALITEPDIHHNYIDNLFITYKCLGDNNSLDVDISTLNFDDILYILRKLINYYTYTPYCNLDNIISLVTKYKSLLSNMISLNYWLLFNKVDVFVYLWNENIFNKRIQFETSNKNKSFKHNKII